MSLKKNLHRPRRLSPSALAVVGAISTFGRRHGLTVTNPSRSESATSRAVVSASGKISPNGLANITAETAGRVVNAWAVNEGEPHQGGSVPVAKSTRIAAHRASTAARSPCQVAQASLEQMHQSVETARVQLRSHGATDAGRRKVLETAAEIERRLERGQKLMFGRGVLLCKSDKSRSEQDSRSHARNARHLITRGTT